MKPTDLQKAADARVVELLERIVASIDGLREDLRQHSESVVEVVRASSNGHAAVNQTAAATTDRDTLRLLSQAEVAALLLIDARTLREARHLGDAPPSIMVGRRPRWRRSDIEKWLMTRRTS